MAEALVNLGADPTRRSAFGASGAAATGAGAAAAAGAGYTPAELAAAGGHRDVAAFFERKADSRYTVLHSRIS